MKSHRVTISEAVQLTERSRRSLYRDMSDGRLAYHLGHDGRRLLDVSELIRAYGALAGMAEPETEGKGTERPEDLLTQILDVMHQQSETLLAQREEMAALRQEVHELRNLPAPGQLAADNRPQPAATDEPDSTPPRDLSDVLARFEARHKPD
ncbi:hypothetical protein [Halomonas piscis]|uniref:hypothetical protein n=1 Tax=Halomonas piscis TaxID=3031727 RepID=UPI00289646B2|nr:hypothetical protein [Halomonas piscis]